MTFNVRGTEIASQVRTKDQAQQVIAELLQWWGTETAYDRLSDEASFAHQTAGETAVRTAGNLLSSFVTRKPNGRVILPDQLF